MFTHFRELIKSERNLDVLQKECNKIKVQLSYSLKAKSKKELIEQLGESLCEVEFLRLNFKLQGSLITDYKKFAKTMERSVMRSKAETENLGKSALKRIKQLDQEVQYLQNILEQRNKKVRTVAGNLATGRKKGLNKRKAKSKELEGQLKQVIADYINAHPDRKLSQKEIAKHLSNSGFVGSQTYTEKTLQRKIAQLIPNIKKELSGQ